ncbi:MAG: hypothetical protein JWM98_113 [Thermoleophilia bacterium]|nr:hypothetical protein [Thermoleophilia bacterium]
MNGYGASGRAPHRMRWDGLFGMGPIAHAAAGHATPAGLRGVLSDIAHMGGVHTVASGIGIAVDTRLAGWGARMAARNSAAAGPDLLRGAGEVGRAAAAYHPMLGDLPAEDAQRARALVEEALDGLQPHLVVNRRVSPADPSSWDGDGLLRTINTSPSRSAGQAARRLIRTAWERATGKYGDGALGGHTVYASLQFTPAPVTGAALTRAGGVRLFGPHVAHLRDTVLDRATIAARDTGPAPHPTLLAPFERLPDVVLERLARTHGFQDDVVIHGGAQRLGLAGPQLPVDARRTFGAWLRDDPRTSVERLRTYLQSPALRDVDHMVEAEVRGVRPGDIDAVALDVTDP